MNLLEWLGSGLTHFEVISLVLQPRRHSQQILIISLFLSFSFDFRYYIYIYIYICVCVCVCVCVEKLITAIQVEGEIYWEVDTIAFRFYWTIIRNTRGYINDFKLTMEV